MWPVVHKGIRPLVNPLLLLRLSWILFFFLRNFETKMDSIFFFFAFLFLCNPKSNWKVRLEIWKMNVCDGTLLVFCSHQFYNWLYLTGSVL